ncbi:MAG: ABC transporter permease [Actinomycetales bacterium]|nr:ABC transporter permease [Actinomycetales bacterium]
MALGHAGVVLVSLAVAAIIAITLGLLSWNKAFFASASLALAGIFLTIPALALLAFMIPIFGLGWVPTVVALSVYSLLPILRNTIVGLRSVPRELMEAARGMGMSKSQVLFQIQMPLAWPLILSGLRVSAQLIVGVATIAAYVAGPGFGTYIFKGLASLGSVNALNFAIVGTVGVVILALVIDGLFAVVSKMGLFRSNHV